VTLAQCEPEVPRDDFGGRAPHHWAIYESAEAGTGPADAVPRAGLGLSGRRSSRLALARSDLGLTACSIRSERGITSGRGADVDTTQDLQ
jgi:hypothetical protein